MTVVGSSPSMSTNMIGKRMTEKLFSYKMGHQVYYSEDDKPVYADTDEPVDEAQERPCNHCGMYRGDNGHDPCISSLPGVHAACCGHGVSSGYIMFEDRSIIKMNLISVKKHIQFNK